MKIVFLSDDFPPQSFGGAGISTYELALSMKRAGHDVSVITTRRKQSEAGQHTYQGLTVFSIASDYPRELRWYLSLYNPPVVAEVEKLLKQIRPDVVHANNLHFYLSYRCLKVAKCYARRVVFTARDVMTFNFAKLNTQRYLESLDPRTTWRDHLAQAGKRWNPFRNACIRSYLGYADRVFAISKSLQEALLKNGIKDVEVIYNGIDVREWAVTEEAITRFREKHGLVGKRVLFFNGRLSEAKGGAKAVEALAVVVKEVPNTVLLIAGQIDEYARSMQELAARLGIEKNLVFTGWIEREEVKLAYAASDVVLMLSLILDAFGRVNIEAMAARKPVIGTRYGGTPEIVIDGVTGYIVDPRHSEEIAGKILELLREPKKAESFGQAGYERAQADFNLEEKVIEYLDAYQYQG